MPALARVGRRPDLGCPPAHLPFGPWLLTGRSKALFRLRPTGGTAVDSKGDLFLLVWVRRGETGHQYILSFDKAGRYCDRVRTA